MSAFDEFADHLRKQQQDRLHPSEPTKHSGPLKKCPGFDNKHRWATIDDFTRGFFEAFFFAEADQDGESLDNLNFTVDDIDDAGFARLMSDCVDFQEKAGDAIEDREMEAGRDFYFTRQGHGAGFWDGDWADPLDEILTDLSKTYGEFYQTTDADGKVWIS